MSDDKIERIAVNASAIIAGMYQWVDAVNDAGGATSMEGVAKCHAMLKSFNGNRAKIDKSVLEPLTEYLASKDKP